GRYAVSNASIPVNVCDVDVIDDVDAIIDIRSASISAVISWSVPAVERLIRSKRNPADAPKTETNSDWAEPNEGDQRRTPVVPNCDRTWIPAPSMRGAVEPAAIVIRCPAPRIITDPAPPVVIDPGPAAISIW